MKKLPALAIDTPEKCMYPGCEVEEPEHPRVYVCDGGEEIAFLMVCGVHDQALLLAEDLTFAFIKRVDARPPLSVLMEGSPE